MLNTLPRGQVRQRVEWAIRRVEQPPAGLSARLRQAYDDTALAALVEEIRQLILVNATSGWSNRLAIAADLQRSVVSIQQVRPDLSFPGDVTFPQTVRFLGQQCSGTLISDRHIVTAAHCFCNTPDSGRECQRRLNEVALSNTENQVFIHGVGNARIRRHGGISIHPEYQWTPGQPLLHDLAIAELDDEHRIPYLVPAQLTTSASFRGPYVSAGFGWTIARLGSAGAQQFPAGLLATTWIASLSEHQGVAGSLVANMSPETGIICGGDSGGPLFLFNPGERIARLRGVNAGSSGRPSGGRCPEQLSLSPNNHQGLLTQFMDLQDPQNRRFIDNVIGHQAISQPTGSGQNQNFAQFSCDSVAVDAEMPCVSRISGVQLGRIGQAAEESRSYLGEFIIARSARRFQEDLRGRYLVISVALLGPRGIRSFGISVAGVERNFSWCDGATCAWRIGRVPGISGNSDGPLTFRLEVDHIPNVPPIIQFLSVVLPNGQAPPMCRGAGSARCDSR
jgi:hypothetical protein